ncbi:beta-ketoacyl-ACP synthase [Entomomonas moraniae]|uniref:Beta-ketoacyl-ACP synthase n=1 Tax=Entomomonas moraniae TaxID=2213226 RepID=A0A3Q9JLZ0_9GAMM|nr:beta-ketoacyl-ACP synthase [Entomomonas moraniae]AZS50175.1 beta-ketoacyl-ACP synthase [Entomomonas moraniae]
MTRRVVVTGMSGITALGNSWEAILPHLKAKHNAIVNIPEWADFQGLHTNLAAPIKNFSLPEHYTRKRTRGMGRVSLMAVRATELALMQAGLLDDVILNSGKVGVAYGSSTGSTDATKDFVSMLQEKNTYGITATTYIQMMPHTAAVNIGLFFGLTGRIIPTSTACTSGSQAIGYAYESIKHGYQTIMVAGGGEELCPSEVAVFDTLFATSQKNDTPKLTPRPFDKDRDGLVIGEGAVTLILEEFEHAKARNATIYAEIVGFFTNCDATHITQPKAETMQVCMEQALKQASLTPEMIGYISAHGTATDKGDIAETNATSAIFGKNVPISTLKSYYGHTLGACGALEAWLSIEMMNKQWFAPTINLENIDPLCGELDYIMAEGRALDIGYLQSNNFAFGGINTSLVFKRC